MKTYPLFINGEPVEPQATAALDVLDPATAEVIARVPDAGAPDVDRAVKAARAAFDDGPWKETTAQAGIVWVNHMQPTFVEAPWGGYKQSGIGRELGKWGVEDYLNLKQVYINLSEQPIGWY